VEVAAVVVVWRGGGGAVKGGQGGSQHSRSRRGCQAAQPPSQESPTPISPPGLDAHKPDPILLTFPAFGAGPRYTSPRLPYPSLRVSRTCRRRLELSALNLNPKP